ncbi:MAG: helix-turn-helix transcriptional regulator [Rhizobiales bacterium]|nr:helix-turn-helix transcriptional regulator [Hyphomicrobiales bacterium]
MLSEDWRKKLSVPNLQLALHERREFAAKVRAARAVLGWSQAALANRIGVTQRTVNRLEQAAADVRRSTAVAIENVFRAEGIIFEALAKGGFRMVVVNGTHVIDISRSGASRD